MTDRLRVEIEAIQGAVVEAKRLLGRGALPARRPTERPFVGAVVDALLAEYPDQLKVTPGKMVYEIQPKVDWNKGKAVQYLLETLHVDADEIVPLYLGDI